MPPVANFTFVMAVPAHTLCVVSPVTAMVTFCTGLTVILPVSVFVLPSQRSPFPSVWSETAVMV